eukprot:gnl/TRDRNA2_/TRDRNA2_158642_c1_seq2.p1 gnl/TRDRNA2_/TRDRNA2_158642_c1~~gnl/TRDRNA2_/TRDRNA2_158642_c1_seq2.p1  ORF type:complete len:109 (-),score=6.27 gnl/TRDRNA2_/TRDRNA2_158642_c1_seq2:95-421(-)
MSLHASGIGSSSYCVPSASTTLIQQLHRPDLLVRFNHSDYWRYGFGGYSPKYLSRLYGVADAATILNLRLYEDVVSHCLSVCAENRYACKGRTLLWLLEKRQEEFVQT